MNTKDKKSSHWRKILEMPFLNGSEVEGEVLVTIVGYHNENFFSPSSKKKEDHIILDVKEFKKGIVLNPRKAQQLERIFGTPYMDDWVGQKVILFSKEEKHFGIWYPVLTFKKAKKVKPELTKEHERWDVAIEKIASGETTISAIEKSYTVSEETKKLINEEVQLIKEKNNG